MEEVNLRQRAEDPLFVWAWRFLIVGCIVTWACIIAWLIVPSGMAIFDATRPEACAQYHGAEVAACIDEAR